jgi:hypothetical protein
MNEGKLLYHLDELIFKDIRLHCTDVTGYAIAGGCIRSLLCGDKVSDYDIFCSSEFSANELISFFQAKVTKGEAKELDQSARLSNYLYKDKWFQIIKKKYWNFSGSTELIDNFDFSICQAMVYSLPKYNINTVFSEDGKQTDLILLTGEYFYQDNLSKHLRVVHIEFPYNTLGRLQKYNQKGYTACRKTLLDIGNALRNMQPNQVLGSLTQTFYGLD